MLRTLPSAALVMLLTTWTSDVHAIQDGELEAVQLYSDEQLLELFESNQHLQRVAKQDRCQLIMDIEAQAELERRPTYQFLYGDMLASGVCYQQDVELGLHFMKSAADQGLVQALERLGRYYHQGTLVQKDVERAILYLREASSLGNLAAQKRFVDILLAGNGSPYDFTHAYHWLHHSVTGDEQEHQAIAERLRRLADKMPASAVEKARQQQL